MLLILILGLPFFYNDFYIEEYLPIVTKKKEAKEFSKRQEALEQKQRDEGVWTMYFDGSISKEGAGAGIWIFSPEIYFKGYSFKLKFECTNNVA